MRILAPASKTSTHFYYQINKLPEDTAEAEYVDALEIIARGLPDLKFLRYSDPLQLHGSH